MMKRYLVLGTSLLAFSLFASGVARAQSAYDWSGPYFGIKGGGAVNASASQTNAFINSGDYDIDGFTIGIMSGYNFQSGNWVFGLDSDMAYADFDGRTGTAGCITSCRTKVKYLGTTRARVGYAFDRFLPYATGGLANGLIEGTTNGVSATSKFQYGWTVGGGLEWAFMDGWSARAEYLYVDLASKYHNPVVNMDIDDMHVVRAGVSMNTSWIWDSIMGR